MSESDCLVDLANAVRRKNTADRGVARLIEMPALSGHFGEFVAAQIFDIKLHRSASHPGSDGVFRTGDLEGKSVDIKYSTKHDRLLNMKKEAGPDYYLVLTGPKGKVESARRTARPWVIESVFLFETKDLLGKLTVNIGTATSVKSEFWDEAEIYPGNGSHTLTLTTEQRERLALFSGDTIGGNP